MELPNNTIIYFGDPLCSWCYGISEEIQKLKDNYQDRFKFEIILGGLRPFEKHPMDRRTKRYLKNHWDQVQARTGMPFDYSILAEDSHLVYNTEKACRAVVAFKALTDNSNHIFSFFKDIQKGFYTEGMDTKQVESYRKYVEKYGISFKDFQEKFEDELIRKATNEDFQTSKQVGVKGFPTVCFSTHGQLIALATGYSTFPLMQEILEKVLTMNASLN